MDSALSNEGAEVVVPPASGQGDSTMPPRPVVPDRVNAFVKKLWCDTDDVPDHKVAVNAARESQKTLFPSWFDRSDIHRGLVPNELRTRADDRRVRTNLAFKYVQQTVAMTVPEDHGMRWEGEPMVGSEDGVADPAVRRLADTLVPVVKTYCDEAGFQEILQACVQDSCQYRLAILKIVFDRSFQTDSVRQHGENLDQQDNVARLASLVEDFHRGIFAKDDARFHEMMVLKDSLGIDGELSVWAGLRVELVPIDSFRFDPAIRSFDMIYRSAWMAHDVMMSIEELKAKYPYKPLDGGDWTGIHPDDLSASVKGEKSTQRTLGNYGTEREKGKGPNPTPDSVAESDRLLVREVWSRKHNRVFVLVDGVPYPVATWVPKNTPSQWYPFRLLRLNRVTGQVYGISDVELMSDIQHRINRKRTDEEKARWLMLPRFIYNTQGIDQEELKKMKDINPGEFKGLNLGGSKLAEVIEQFEAAFNLQAFDTSRDEFEMQQMAAIPAQMLGATGQAKYAAEVEAGMQGAAISANNRGAIIRRFVEGTYDMIAEILLQELTADDVHEVAGPMAFWPTIYGDGEANRMVAQLTEQATLEVTQSELVATSQGAPPLDEVSKQSAVADAVKQKCLAAFGWETPITRQSLYRFLHCKVTVSMNTMTDRQQRLQGIQQIFASIQMGAQAAQAAGMMFDPRPLLKQASPLFNGDAAITEMFKPLMAAPMAPGMGAPGLPPTVAGQMAPQDNTTGAVGAPSTSPNSAVETVETPGNAV